VIRVLVAEDEALYRTGLRLILEAQPDIEVAGEASDGAAAVEAAFALEVDVVLMDVRMSGMDGLEAARRMAAAGGPRVLLLTSFDLDEYIEQALTIGVGGFVLKSASVEELVWAVRRVAAGGGVLDPAVAPRVIEAFSRRRMRLSSVPPLLATLSKREQEVLVHVARGLSNREIARSLGLGEATVRTHVGHLLAKLDLRSRGQAIALAYEVGLVGADSP
jgi:DNA-binding NarL/FixJ family response regulator